MHMHSGERPSLARTFEMVETTALRRRMERAVEALLAALDELDGDPNLEPSGDELDTSAPEGWRRFDMRADNDDAEDDDPAELDDFPEEDDPAGGDVLDEPHDAANTFDDVIADQDAADLVVDELKFADWMDRTRDHRREASDVTLQAPANVTGRRFRSLHAPLRAFHPANHGGGHDAA